MRFARARLPDGGSSTVGDPALSACVLRVFNSIAFPKPEKGEVGVRYPLLFIPGEPAPPTNKPTK